MPEDESFSKREAIEFARFLYHPDTFVEWWKPEDEFLLNGALQRRHYSRLEAKK